MDEWVVRIVLGVSNLDALISVEGTGEFIAVNDTEDTAIELDIDSDAEVLPRVGLNTAGLWNEMTLQENALGNA